MNKKQIVTALCLLALITFGLCFHIYRADQYRQEMLSIERVRLSIDNWRTYPESLDMGKQAAIRHTHRLLEYDKAGAPQQPPSQPMTPPGKSELQKLLDERRAEGSGTGGVSQTDAKP